MKKFKSTNSGNYSKVELIECDKETDKCVFVDGRRYSKETECESFYDTFDEAINRLKYQTGLEIEKYSRNIRYHQTSLEKILAIKNPEEQ